MATRYSFLIAIQLCLVSAFSPKLFAQNNSPEAQAILDLIETAQVHFAKDNESLEAYLLGKKACLEAEKLKNRTLLNLATHSLVRNSNVGANYDEVLELAQSSVDANDNIEGSPAYWQSLLDLAYLYQATYKFDLALETSQLSFAVAENLQNDSMKCMSYLSIGEAMNGESKKLDAFRYIFNALKIAESNNSPSLKFEVYSVLTNFYNFNEGFTRSIFYNNRRLDLLKAIAPNDTVERYSILLHGEEINFFSNNNALNEELVDEILLYAKQKGNVNLRKIALALYRSHLIEAQDFQGLDELYNEQFPEDLEHLGHERPALHAKVLACIYEYRNQIDSSLYYYRLSEFLLDGEDNPILKANSYIRYGQFLERHGKYKDAIQKFERGFQLASTVPYYHYMLQASDHLHDLHAQEGNYEEAYKYSMLNQKLEDSLALMSKKDQLIVMAFSKEMERDSVKRERERLATAKAHKEEVAEKKRQTRTIAGVGLFILLFAGGLYNRLRYVRKSRAEIQTEKDRSEGLLLNILPKDIAEELKQNGSAEAKKFENVSIVFTDFKNFTQAAEDLPAIDLVKQVNDYFKLFDEITSEFGVEKIKTIGDAYMAAGGIPRSYQDSVKRTVLAALEMQKRMKELNEEKKAVGAHTFEMRIGIHTGPVVAGIVGTKKFQYDIWGDTVNTAARMEQTGKTGEVNISGDTYNIVKDEPEFEFEARGKVEAKNKGEIEMYFVKLRSSF